VLSDITKELPLPANPFVEGFKFFAQYGTKVIAQLSSADADSVRDIQARMAFEFSPDGNCVGSMETTGAKLIVLQFAGAEADGFVDVTKASEYCWQFFQKPLREVRFARRAGDKCPTEPSAYTALSNPHYFGILIAINQLAHSAPVRRVIKAPAPGTETDAILQKSDLRNLIDSWSRSATAPTVPTDRLIDAAEKFGNIERNYLRFAGKPTVSADALERLGYSKIDTTDLSGKKYGLTWTMTDSLGTKFFEQQVPQYEAAAADIAAAVQRCKNFGISIADCL
jgi:hypothetical protein